MTDGTKEMAILPDQVAVINGITDDLDLMTKSKQMALMPDLVFFIINDVVNKLSQATETQQKALMPDLVSALAVGFHSTVAWRPA